MSATNIYGRERLKDFTLDPAKRHLNHGGYGATPRKVLAHQAAIRAEIEADPTGFFSFAYPKRIREAAVAVSRLLGGQGTDWAFVENASAGANAVIASWRLQRGEEVLFTNHIYAAVKNTLRHHAEPVGAVLTEIMLPRSYPGDDVFLDQFAKAITPRTRYVIVDHISSSLATLFPVAALTALCHSHGISVLIDGAHAPGQIPLDASMTGADWYIGNLHKWAFAPRACGVLYAAPNRRDTLHPRTISHYWGQDFPAEFDWIGTMDVSSWLAAPAGLAFWEEAGGYAAMTRNHQLAVSAAEVLIEHWGTSATAGPVNIAAMASIALPHQGDITAPEAAHLYERLWHDHGIVAPIFAVEGKAHIRIAAQIYNELPDYLSLIELLPRLIKR